MKFLIIFIYLISTTFSYSIEQLNIKNIVINNEPITHKNVIFKDLNNQDIDLKDFNNKLLILNFWATWCKPCLEEMPSLDLLQSNKSFNNLKIFPINIGQEDLLKSKEFFQKLNIKNLKIFYDPSVDLAKKFKLRGIPTTVLINKDGKEFARVIGSIDFRDKQFIDWLKNYN